MGEAPTAVQVGYITTGDESTITRAGDHDHMYIRIPFQHTKARFELFERAHIQRVQLFGSVNSENTDIVTNIGQYVLSVHNGFQSGKRLSYGSANSSSASHVVFFQLVGTRYRTERGGNTKHRCIKQAK